MRTDVHTHLIPRLPAEAVASAGLGLTDDGRLAAAGHLIGGPRLHDLAALTGWMAEADVDRALVSVPPPCYRQGLGPSATLAWVRALNDALASTLEGEPGLLPLGYLPLDRPEGAILEAQRLIDDGWVGFVGSAGGASVPLDEPSLAPLWERLEASNRPMLLHPGASPDPRLKPHYLDNLLGNPVETAVAAGQLLLGGVLARFSRLRLALVHCGGVLPAVLGRWQRGVDTARPGVERTGADLRSEAALLWADTLAHDPRQVDVAVETFGIGHLLLGSDWPFPMGLERPLDAVAHLSEADAMRVAVDNAAAFLGEQ